MNKTFPIVAIIIVVLIALLFIVGMPAAEKKQCTGKNQFYAFGGKVYSCKNWTGAN